MLCWWSGVTSAHGYFSAQGSELSGWTTGHFTEDGFDIFQNFPDLSNILWDAEDKGMVPKVIRNHHVPIPENYEGSNVVRGTVPLCDTTRPLGTVHHKIKIVV